MRFLLILYFAAICKSYAHTTPSSTYRNIFLSIIHDLIEFEECAGSLDNSDNRSLTSHEGYKASGISLGSIRSPSIYRFRGLSCRSIGAQSPETSLRESACAHSTESTAKAGALYPRTMPPGTSMFDQSESSVGLELLSPSVESVPLQSSSSRRNLVDVLTPGRPLLTPSLSRSMHGARKSSSRNLRTTDGSVRHSGGASNSLRLSRGHLQTPHPPTLARAQTDSGTRENTSKRYNRMHDPEAKDGLTASLRTISSRNGLASSAHSRRSNRQLAVQDRQCPHPVPHQSLPSLAGRDCASVASGTESNCGLECSSAPYFEKLIWACETLGYPFEYADIVGSQFLGLESASPITDIDGHVPTMDELVEFLAEVFDLVTEFADLVVLFVDDFQWVDSFSWKIFRTLCKKQSKLLLICAMKSHDKQALRRLSSIANRQSELQAQTVEISLGPLGFSDIKEMMSAVLGYDESVIPDDLCADIYQKSGGLPVYISPLLEDMRRKRIVELNEDGVLQWTDEGLKQRRAVGGADLGDAMIEETFLSRFDMLEVRVRKVLQTCAILGLSFSLSDAIRVHPEMEKADIESAVDIAVVRRKFLIEIQM